MATIAPDTTTGGAALPWRGFRKGMWQVDIDVRDFIQQNYEPYEGDASFLAPVTDRTRAIWDRRT